LVVAAGAVAVVVLAVVAAVVVGVLDAAEVELLELLEEPQPAKASAITTVIGRARLTDRTPVIAFTTDPPPYKRSRPGTGQASPADAELMAPTQHPASRLRSSR
jgi:hypothetical protein